jgi:hypothetical protein
MLVVCPPRAQLARVSVKVVAIGAFEVVVIDLDGLRFRPSGFDHAPAKPGTCRRPGEAGDVPSRFRPSAPSFSEPKFRHGSERRKNWPPEVLVRKLSLAAEPSGATVLLLTDSTRPREAAWPTALRLELGRPNQRELSVRIAKDRRGRVSLAKTLPFHPVVREVG